MNYSVSEISAMVSPLARKYGIERMYLFGSRARGTADGSSDYDFLISKGEMKGLQFVSFIYDLESLFGTHVDVVTDTSINCIVLPDAKREGVLVYERLQTNT